jgi:ABC-type sugar transport system ATPase subunit
VPGAQSRGTAFQATFARRSLSVTQTAEVLNLIEQLRDLGYGLMFISHTLADVQAVADRIVVMRHGRINGEALMSEVTYEDIIAAITGVPNELTRSYRERGPLAPPLALTEVNASLPMPPRLSKPVPSGRRWTGTYGR